MKCTQYHANIINKIHLSGHQVTNLLYVCRLVFLLNIVHNYLSSFHIFCHLHSYSNRFVLFKNNHTMIINSLHCINKQLLIITFHIVISQFFYSNKSLSIMMASVETVDLKVCVKKGNNVSALIKIFGFNYDDSIPKRRQNTVIVTDGGRYAPRSDVAGTWRSIQPNGDCSGGGRRMWEIRRKLNPVQDL